MAGRPTKAKTADGTMMFPALEEYLPEEQRVTDDPLAIHMLSRSVRLMTRTMKSAFLRGLMMKSMDKSLPGIQGGMLGRKRYADDKVTEALASGIEQFVLLGAGFDSRACRLIAPAGALAYEVDLPGNIDAKRKVLRQVYGELPARVTLVPVDFESDSLADQLSASGFDVDQRAMFVWEAVTQYLTEDAFRATLDYLANAATGSRLVFTFVRKDFIDGENLYGWEKAYKKWCVEDKVWKFGLVPDDVGGLLGAYGWTELEQLGAQDYAERYFEPAGRDLTAIDIERSVHAERSP